MRHPLIPGMRIIYASTLGTLATQDGILPTSHIVQPRDTGTYIGDVGHISPGYHMTMTIVGDQETVYVPVREDHFAIEFVSEDGSRAGYAAGSCGHAIAMTEWLAGFRDCERCSRTTG